MAMTGLKVSENLLKIADLLSQHNVQSHMADGHENEVNIILLSV
jgi:hypothetical protein